MDPPGSLHGTGRTGIRDTSAASVPECRLSGKMSSTRSPRNPPAPAPKSLNSRPTISRAAGLPAASVDAAATMRWVIAGSPRAAEATLAPTAVSRTPPGRAGPGPTAPRGRRPSAGPARPGTVPPHPPHRDGHPASVVPGAHRRLPRRLLRSRSPPGESRIRSPAVARRTAPRSRRPPRGRPPGPRARAGSSDTGDRKRATRRTAQWSGSCANSLVQRACHLATSGQPAGEPARGRAVGIDDPRVEQPGHPYRLREYGSSGTETAAQRSKRRRATVRLIRVRRNEAVPRCAATSG